VIRDWIPTLIVAMALVLLLVWIANHTYWQEVPVPMPLKGEAATNPFYTAQRLAESLGAHTEWRHEVLTSPGLDTVIVVSSWNWNLFPDRRARLEGWVRAGGRLVLDQTVLSSAQLQEWVGISQAYVEKATGHASGEANGSRATHDDAEDEDDDEKCASVAVTASDPSELHPKSYYEYCGLRGQGHLMIHRKTLWALHDATGVRAARVRIGRGTVTAFTARPFGNRELLQADHAALFVDGTQLRRGDEVIFLSEGKGASLLQLVWDHGAPAVVFALALLGLALWRAGVRFGPLAAIPDPARRSLAEQIRGTGQFTVRFGGGRALHAAAVRALAEAADRHVVQYSRLSSDERIATLARLTGLRGEELSQALHYAGPRRPAELRSAVTLLELARRAVSAQDSNAKNKRKGSRHAG